MTKTDVIAASRSRSPSPAVTSRRAKTSCLRARSAEHLVTSALASCKHACDVTLDTDCVSRDTDGVWTIPLDNVTRVTEEMFTAVRQRCGDGACLIYENGRAFVKTPGFVASRHDSKITNSVTFDSNEQVQSYPVHSFPQSASYVSDATSSYNLASFCKTVACFAFFFCALSFSFDYVAPDVCGANVTGFEQCAREFLQTSRSS